MCYNTLVAGYASNLRWGEIEGLLGKMRAGDVRPDQWTCARYIPLNAVACRYMPLHASGRAPRPTSLCRTSPARNGSGTAGSLLEA